MIEVEEKSDKFLRKKFYFKILGSCLAVALAEPIHIHYDTTHYHGPPAPLDKIGRVIDTPEVAHAKAKHLAIFEAEAAKSSHSYSSGGGDEGGSSGGASEKHPPQHHHVEHHYHGPPAPLDHHGKVIDTKEVEHAKAAHFHAVQEELAKIKHSEPHSY